VAVERENVVAITALFAANKLPLRAHRIQLQKPLDNPYIQKAREIKSMGEKLTSAKAWSILTFVLAWAFCTAASPLRAQNQNPYGQDEPSASSQPAPPQEGDASPVQPPNQGEAAPAQIQGAPAQRPGVPVPPTLTLPAGTVISVRATQWLSSDKNHPGDIFSATIDQPLVANGWVVARRGQTVLGRVDVAQKASEGNGVSRLGVEITELTLVDGEQVPVSTQMQQAAPSPYSQNPPGRSAATVATTTALGTIVGAAVGRGVGAAIGAGLGATAGAAVVLSSRGRATMIAPETLLTFQLSSPASISTEKGSVAFRPVSQSDYRDQDAYVNGPGRRPVYGPPAPYYYGGYYASPYPYCGWYCYPGPYVGVGFGWGGWGPYYRGGFGRVRVFRR